MTRHFDSAKHALGRLCKNGHEWYTTGQSLRYLSTGGCVVCQTGRKAAYKRKRGPRPQTPTTTDEIPGGPKTSARFAALCERHGDCLLYRGPRNAKGYGNFALWSGPHRIWMLAHRFAWLIAHGALPRDACVCHNCPGGDNPSCVNPDHLWLGTKTENNADMAAKGRARGPTHLVGEKQNMAKLTTAQVEEIRRRLTDGESGSSLARTFGVCTSTISMIKHRRTWTS